VEALRAKSVALTSLFIDLVERQCAAFGVELVSPRDPARRGSQVCFRQPHAFPVMQALIARGVIGDFRAPDVLRFGFAPLYVRHVDVWDAATALAQVLTGEEWRSPAFQQRGAVT
jgi:kynureninase